MGNRGADFGHSRRGKGIGRETGDGGRCLVASEPIEDGGERSWGGTDNGDVA